MFLVLIGYFFLFLFSTIHKMNIYNKYLQIRLCHYPPEYDPGPFCILVRYAIRPPL